MPHSNDREQYRRIALMRKDKQKTNFVSPVNGKAVADRRGIKASRKNGGKTHDENFSLVSAAERFERNESGSRRRIFKSEVLFEERLLLRAQT